MEIGIFKKINIIKNSDLVQSSLIYTIINFVNKAFPFFLLPLFTRAFSLEDYGTFSIYRATTNICIPLVGLSLSESVIRSYYEREKIDFGTYICSVLFVNIGTIGLLQGCLFLFGSALLGVTGLSREMLCLALLISFFTSINNIERGLYRCERKNKLLTTMIIGQSLLYFLLIFALYWLNKLHIRAAIYVEVFVYFLFASLGGGYLIREYSLSFKIRAQYIRNALIYSSPLVINGIMAYAFALSDRYIINYQLGEKFVAIYSASFQIVSILQILAVSFNAAWVPWIFENLNKKINPLKLLTIQIGAALFFLILGVMFWSIVSRLLPVIVGEKYKDGIFLLGWFVGANTFQAFYWLVAPILQYYKKNWYLLMASAPAFLFSVGLNMFFLKKFGMGFAAKINCVSWSIIFLITVICAFNVIRHANKKTFVPNYGN